MYVGGVESATTVHSHIQTHARTRDRALHNNARRASIADDAHTGRQVDHTNVVTATRAQAECARCVPTVE